MDVYFGRFLSNGGCGYVLKPTYLRYDNAAAAAAASSSIVSGRFSTNLYSSNTPQILHIKVSLTLKAASSHLLTVDDLFVHRSLVHCICRNLNRPN